MTRKALWKISLLHKSTNWKIRMQNEDCIPIGGRVNEITWVSAQKECIENVQGIACVKVKDHIHCTVPVVQSNGQGVSSMHRVVHAQAQNPSTPVDISRETSWDFEKAQKKERHLVYYCSTIGMSNGQFESLGSVDRTVNSPDVTLRKFFAIQLKHLDFCH